MHDLFAFLTASLSGSSVAAAFAALAWGVLSIVLSPCHLVSIPLVVAFTSNQQRVTAHTGLVYGGLFAAGMLLTVLAIGLITAALGRFLGNTGTVGLIGQLVSASVLIVIGLWMADLLRLSFLEKLNGPAMQQKRGRTAAFAAGLLFGLSAGPCTFAWMAPILAVTFNSARESFANALWLFGWFALGHGGILVLAGVFSGAVEKLLHWNNANERTALRVKKILALLIVLGGAVVGYDAVAKLV